MRVLLVPGFMALAVFAQNPNMDPFKVAPDHYKLLLDNAWVRVAQVTYGPHETAPVHDHSLTPTALYIYVTDGGPFRFKHITGMKVAGYTVTRPAVKAGAIRFSHSAPETHSVEYLGDAPTEYLRIELRTEAPQVLLHDVRIPPAAMDPATSAVRKEFENGQIRILRLVCAPGEKCPASEHPDDPSLVAIMSGPEKGSVRWSPAGQTGPLDEIRVELKTDPVAN